MGEFAGGVLGGILVSVLGFWFARHDLRKRIEAEHELKAQELARQAEAWKASHPLDAQSLDFKLRDNKLPNSLSDKRTRKT